MFQTTKGEGPGEAVQPDHESADRSDRRQLAFELRFRSSRPRCCRWSCWWPAAQAIP
jgi:hypothetical protein